MIEAALRYAYTKDIPNNASLHVPWIQAIVAVRCVMVSMTTRD